MFVHTAGFLSDVYNINTTNNEAFDARSVIVLEFGPFPQALFTSFAVKAAKMITPHTAGRVI